MSKLKVKAMEHKHEFQKSNKSFEVGYKQAIDDVMVIVSKETNIIAGKLLGKVKPVELRPILELITDLEDKIILLADK